MEENIYKTEFLEYLNKNKKGSFRTRADSITGNRVRQSRGKKKFNDYAIET